MTKKRGKGEDAIGVKREKSRKPSGILTERSESTPTRRWPTPIAAVLTSTRKNSTTRWVTLTKPSDSTRETLVHSHAEVSPYFSWEKSTRRSTISIQRFGSIQNL